LTNIKEPIFFDFRKIKISSPKKNSYLIKFISLLSKPCTKLLVPEKILDQEVEEEVKPLVLKVITKVNPEVVVGPDQKVAPKVAILRDAPKVTILRDAPKVDIMKSVPKIVLEVTLKVHIMKSIPRVDVLATKAIIPEGIPKVVLEVGPKVDVL
jgi:hypothetical protein